MIHENLWKLFKFINRWKFWQNPLNVGVILLIFLVYLILMIAKGYIILKISVKQVTFLGVVFLQKRDAFSKGYSNEEWLPKEFCFHGKNIFWIYKHMYIYIIYKCMYIHIYISQFISILKMRMMKFFWGRKTLSMELRHW